MKLLFGIGFHNCLLNRYLYSFLVYLVRCFHHFQKKPLLLNSISKKKRFSKWHKKDAETESIRLVKEYFGYSDEKAVEALSVLSEDQLVMIKERDGEGHCYEVRK